jgi:hypothetical protein
MNLEKLLKQKQTDIVKQWFESVVDSYPPDTAKFLKRQKDMFLNPVGNTAMQSVEALFAELLGGMNHEDLASFIDPLIRIRAVQPLFSPSQAVTFIFLLKKVIRKSLKKELHQNQLLSELLLFESKIDELSLIAFDKYMECREKIYRIKAAEEKNRFFRAFERAGLVTELPEDGPGLEKI